MQLSLGHAINGVPLHAINKYSPSHGLIPLRNFTFGILPMEYPHAQLSNIFSNITLSHIATLSLTFHQRSTPMHNHLTFFLTLPHPVSQLHPWHAINGVPLCTVTEHSLTSPHPVLQLCLQHSVNGVPPHSFISFIFSLAIFHFLAPHLPHLFFFPCSSPSHTMPSPFLSL